MLFATTHATLHATSSRTVLLRARVCSGAIEREREAAAGGEGEERGS